MSSLRNSLYLNVSLKSERHPFFLGSCFTCIFDKKRIKHFGAKIVIKISIFAKLCQCLKRSGRCVLGNLTDIHSWQFISSEASKQSL